ncbi:hypothetical protein J7F01_32805 [Streptomyces sp. ISL-22]|uniref:Uncharacterized protein n=1 Tax=Streptomyces viridochromogenes Tue57 TaxID=1160705 RepID=L8PMI9_STRVR|nr:MULTISPECIES: hypothetical protein [Streptomyces]ELS58821.1 hypothetical protein STVIR_0209 [Streptomyces viridochromogenes Tue57]MBT2419356.1 hypothetical protein [Streptomyces sp. ISL-24]MBT2436852.1 hypothetical protein [Streptomyces sp. ISL-22]
MFQDSPIYDRLIAERGDIPTQVRREAERVSREVEFAMQPLLSIGHAPAAARPAPPAPTWQRSALPPAPR